MAEPMNASSLLLVLHDVAPQTWADYQPFVDAVDALGEVPMTWLVVPDFHKHNDLEAHPGFRRMLTGRVGLGDELALHGYFHCDESPAPHTPRDWFMRRIYTHEGEFYSLSQEAALARLRAGIEVFHRYHWPLEGFVAPAWLMSEGTRRALRQLPLSYTSDPQHLYRLPDFTPVDAPGLVWSARSAWRRGLSKLVSDQREQRWRQAPVIRLGLHPVDMRHPFSRNYWLQTLKRLLAEGRVPLTKARWLALHDDRVGRAA
ncbi:DUF2334 domain-containing protein [Pseudomonas migulae]|uniref:Deacetylase n=1 Tax=Pseudomonas migulae TaxID=78543 RepID=A0A1H5MJB6_9PSED|nr:polysaccharide deacetylase family protein [Pseudomonas migulae]SEE89424.1 hypothetical protein SAMN04490194_4830 [Pseudomonas migulae]